MIDWDRVAALRDEVGPEDFEEIVDLFLDEVDDEIATLSNHQNGAQLAEKLHFLKGSALNLGFTDFSLLCHCGEVELAKNSSSQFDVTALQKSYSASRDHFLAHLPARMTT